MHSVAMGFEVIQSWPYFLSFGAVESCTPEASIDSVRRNNMMYTFFVPVKIILCTKPFFPCAVRFIANERLAMALTVFPEATLVSNDSL